MQTEMMLINHAEERTSAGEILKDTGLNLLGNLIAAKEEGKELPGFLDKIATILTSSQKQAEQIVKKEAQKEATNKMGWIIAVVLLIIIIGILIANK